MTSYIRTSQGRPHEALAAAERAEAASPIDNANWRWIHLARSIALRQLGDVNAALAQADAGAAAAREMSGLTELGDLELERARCLHALGRIGEAREALDAAGTAYGVKEHLVGMQNVANLRAELANVG